jgi:transitional endoplasmic reticulum ATPase
MSRSRKITAVQLKVAEARQRDVGKARARLDTEMMASLGVSPGDVLEITGKESTVATAWPADSDDEWLGIIRIDGQTRKNAGVAINEFVTVRRAETRVARSMTLVPIGTKLTVDRDFTEFVRNRLHGLPVTEGDDLSVVILGNPIPFRVSSVRPRAPVRIEHETRVVILQEPLATKKGTPRVTYEEIGGLKEEIRRLREIVELPLRHPEVFQRLGIEAPSGILMYGPPGCGKTLLAKALASESEANFLSVNGPEIMNKYYGETEARLRELFKEAREKAPAILFLDEIDAVSPKREEVFGDVEKRVVAQLLALMDGLGERGNVIVIGATNRPDSVDPALRRPGRFDREVEIGVPNSEDRVEILHIHTRGMPLEGDIDLGQLAAELHGYTGADLRALCREAALKALRRYLPGIDLDRERVPPEVLGTMTVTAADFRSAAREIVPTAMREFYVETPRVRWAEVGGLPEVKKNLMENVVWAIRHRERFQQLGVQPPGGLLLYGPSGCGKTLLARGLATESGANFITVRGPEVLSKWVGESEKAIRDIFRKAKASAPCVIFFDEIDALARARSAGGDEGGVGERVLSQLLTEIDSAHIFGDLFVLAATNRPDLLDSALLRPGRLDLLVYVPPPDETARLDILRIRTSRMPIGADVQLEELTRVTKGYSGADLEALCREAAIAALRRRPQESIVERADFEAALRRIRPSVAQEVEAWYESLYKQMRGMPRAQPFFA